MPQIQRRFGHKHGWTGGDWSHSTSRFHTRGLVEILEIGTMQSRQPFTLGFSPCDELLSLDCSC